MKDTTVNQLDLVDYPPPHVDIDQPKKAHSFQGRVAHSPDRPYALPKQVIINIEGLKQHYIHLTKCFNLEISVAIRYRYPGNRQIFGNFLAYFKITHGSRKSQGK